MWSTIFRHVLDFITALLGLTFLASLFVLLIYIVRLTISSKTQAYIEAVKPILMAVDGDAAELVKAGNCGIITESENPELIADAITLFENDASMFIGMGK